MPIVRYHLFLGPKMNDTKNRNAFSFRSHHARFFSPFARDRSDNISACSGYCSFFFLYFQCFWNKNLSFSLGDFSIKKPTVRYELRGNFEIFNVVPNRKPYPNVNFHRYCSQFKPFPELFRFSTNRFFCNKTS